MKESLQHSPISPETGEGYIAKLKEFGRGVIAAIGDARDALNSVDAETSAAFALPSKEL